MGGRLLAAGSLDTGGRSRTVTRVTSRFLHLLVLPALLLLVPLGGVASAQTAGDATPAVRLSTGVDDNAWTHDLPPRLTIERDGGGTVRLTRWDFLTETPTEESVEVPAAGRVELEPDLPYGLFRFDAFIGDADTPAATLRAAHAPAYRAADLPDSWPLGTHLMGGQSPPLPGFKWYRTFYHWASAEPEPGNFAFGPLDWRVNAVREIGGKLILCGDGAPEWTTGKPDKNRGILGSQYFPDDAESLRAYVRTVIDRYDDGSGTLAVLEMWNEPNANDRWADTPEKLIDLYRIFHEETRGTGMVTAGPTISPGHHLDYHERLVELGALEFCDVITGHFYEEMGSLQRETPVNNLAMHAAMLRNAMLRRGIAKPMWNTETEAHATQRQDDTFVSQKAINEYAEASPKFNPEEPWRLGGWRKPSERRHAASGVTGVAALMEEGVSKSFTFHPNWYREDGTLILHWVAQMVFGSFLKDVDHTVVMPFAIDRVGGPEGVSARAIRFGRFDGPSFVLAFALPRAEKFGRVDRWAPFVEPVPLTFRTQAEEVTVIDAYRRTERTVQAVDGRVTIEAGEEPVYLLGLSGPANP